MPRYQIKGKTNRHNLKTPVLTDSKTPVLTDSKQSTTTINKTIQQVVGGSTKTNIDSLVSNSVQANRKLNKFIKFSL
jgi:hypothetical protein